MSIAITEYKNAKSLKADNSIMDVEINHPNLGWIPYTIDKEDTDQTINNDDLLARIGDDFTKYVPPTQEEINEGLAIDARAERNFKLVTEVDPIAGNSLRWNELSSEQQAAWTQYRTNLLNVPQQSEFPNNVTWPTKPS